MLSKKVKYAIKALLYLYQCNDQIPISAKKIAEAEKIPYKFLEAILNDLKFNNIVQSQRGPYGGYSFAKDPNEISVASIMRIIDGPIALTSCTSENFYEKCDTCIDENTCKIRKLFLELRIEMIPILEKSITEVYLS